MNIKAEAAFTTVVNAKTGAADVDGGFEVSAEIIPDTPMQHELLVALLGAKSEPQCEVTFDVAPVTEKITFKVRFEKDGIVAAAHARLGDRKEAEDAGLPLHLHLEAKAKKAELAAKAEAEAKKAAKTAAAKE